MRGLTLRHRSIADYIDVQEKLVGLRCFICRATDCVGAVPSIDKSRLLLPSAGSLDLERLLVNIREAVETFLFHARTRFFDNFGLSALLERQEGLIENVPILRNDLSQPRGLQGKLLIIVWIIGVVRRYGCLCSLTPLRCISHSASGTGSGIHPDKSAQSILLIEFRQVGLYILKGLLLLFESYLDVCVFFPKVLNQSDVLLLLR